MKLTDMHQASNHKRLNKVMESRFGFTIDYDSLTMDKATRLSGKINESIDRLRRSHASHALERDPQFMELMMVREGIQMWMKNYRNIFESELGKSEAVLAAKDIVDSIQDMLEKVGKMQNEQMPALMDSIRDQIGSAQADQFRGSVEPIFKSLYDTLSNGRNSADVAARTLAGEQTEQPMDMGAGGMGGGELGGGADMGGHELGGAEAGGLDTGSDFDSDEFGATDAATGGAEELGRQRR